MNIKDTLVNFLYDKEYFITIYENYIHVFNYKKLISLTSKLIVLEMNKFNLEIKGSELFITKMSKNELLIKGYITKVGLNYV
ncbi:hypothetical protein EGR52_04585 [bacterium]|nr:hypothetical protein [bacterium]MBD8922685.1 hypothetical protein [bacterium]